MGMLIAKKILFSCENTGQHLGSFQQKAASLSLNLRSLFNQRAKDALSSCHLDISWRQWKGK